MTNNYHSRVSGLYSHLANRTLSIYWQARANHILKGLQIQSTDSVLEVGCGAGMWTSYIAPRVKTTCALDLDMITLKLARLWKSPRRPIQPTDQVNFAQGSALQLPYKDSTFSKLLAVDVIEHIPDHYSAGREFARVLQPKGRLVLTTLLKNRPSYVMPMSFDDHVREYTLAELRSVVEDAGLKVAHHFYFYHKYSLIAREIQVFAANTAIGRNVVTGLGVGFLCRLIAYMETVRRVGQPAGVGIVAKAS